MFLELSTTREICSRFFNSLSKSFGILVFSDDMMIGRLISDNLKLPLLIVGEGPEMQLLSKFAGPTVKLLGYQTMVQVEELMSRCRAFVYAGVEDFGIAPVEAMASGSPVIGFGKGGLLDTVRCASSGVPSPTGILFHEQTVESLSAAVAWFEERRLWREISSESLRQWSEKFSPEAFSKRFEEVLNSSWLKHQKACAFECSDPAQLFEGSY